MRTLQTEREADRKRHRRNVRILVLVAIAALLLLWTSGRMDPTLSHIGLNYNDCVTNGFGATFCGDDAQTYRHRRQPPRLVEAALRADSTNR